MNFVSKIYEIQLYYHLINSKDLTSSLPYYFERSNIIIYSYQYKHNMHEYTTIDIKISLKT